MPKPFKPTESTDFENSIKVPMSKQQRRRLQQGDTDIRDTEHGDVWYTRNGVKYLMDTVGKIVTSYPVKGDARPTRVIGKAPLSDYEVLRAAGHGPFDALRIVSDANRGDQHAISEIVQARKQQL